MANGTTLPETLVDRARSTGRRLRNGARYVLRLNEPQLGQSPRDLVARRDNVTLYRYRNEAVTMAPPLLLVMSLVTRPTVFDLQPGNSLVERFCGAGLDVYMLDWGEPGPADSANTLETYCDEYLPWAVDATTAHSGADSVTLFGYCFGGFLSFLSLAANPDMAVANLVCLATPVAPDRGPAQLRPGRFGMGEMDDAGNVPAETLRAAFVALDPIAEVTTRVNLWHRLDDDDYLLAHQVMTGWGNDHIPFPGATAAQMNQLFADRNPILEGDLHLGGRPVDPKEITVPFLSVVGERDHIAPRATSEPLLGLVGSEDRTEVVVPAGHVGLFVGKSAAKQCLPAIVGWISDHSTPA
jgi:polyhydroxyalkanoate synthase